MNLARTGGRLVVEHHGKWFPLNGFRGYERFESLGALLTAHELGALAEDVGKQADHVEPMSFDPGAADTIADAGTDIWGAGLNYRRHSEDLDAAQPASGPGSYLRPSGCLIGNGDAIELPEQSARVTAEAELGLVIGKRCRNVPRADWRSVIAGATAVLDMTAEDVIRENPRYIPWAKGFDTFCSVGPVLCTLDVFGDLDALSISTVHNGEPFASGTPADMKYDLGYLVEYFTAGRTLEPGTVLCTGTPGAVPINAGDTVEAAVAGVGTLTHPVRKTRDTAGAAVAGVGTLTHPVRKTES